MIAGRIEGIDGIAVAGRWAQAAVREARVRRGERGDRGSVAVDGVAGNAHVIGRCLPADIDRGAPCGSRRYAGGDRWWRRVARLLEGVGLDVEGPSHLIGRG